MAKAFSQRKLDGLRREWQKLLRLQDWKITAKFVNSDEIAEDRVGECNHLAEAREADINILLPSSDEVVTERDQDVENTLVHELLHCHFAPFRDEDRAVVVQHEQAIEAITEALLVLKRKKGKN